MTVGIEIVVSRHKINVPVVWHELRSMVVEVRPAVEVRQLAERNVIAGISVHTTDRWLNARLIDLTVTGVDSVSAMVH